MNNNIKIKQTAYPKVKITFEQWLNFIHGRMYMEQRLPKKSQTKKLKKWNKD